MVLYLVKDMIGEGAAMAAEVDAMHGPNSMDPFILWQYVHYLYPLHAPAWNWNDKVLYQDTETYLIRGTFLFLTSDTGRNAQST